MINSYYEGETTQNFTPGGAGYAPQGGFMRSRDFRDKHNLSIGANGWRTWTLDPGRNGGIYTARFAMPERDTLVSALMRGLTPGDKACPGLVIGLLVVFGLGSGCLILYAKRRKGLGRHPD